jgi:putative NIF3 family GTP cyclohydrolase 1 type 2
MSRPSHLTRREFAALAASAATAPFVFTQTASGSAAITVDEVIARIRKNVGVEWKPDSVDTVKAGDPATRVTGVVTTAMATLDVLRQAVAAGANLVITAEPTFYSRGDARTPPAGRGRGGPGAAPGAAGASAGRGPGAPPAAPPPADPVFTAKNDFITANNLVIFRLSDHWRLRRPDPFGQGIATALGWSGREIGGDATRYDIAPATLDAFASDVKRKLGVRGGMRVIGDPQTRVQKVALLPGSTPITASLQVFPAVDVVIAGEVREWESAEYARDVVFSGQRKGLILLGRIVSEEAGMATAARWLESFVAEVPVRHLPAGDPYWRPA